MYKVRSDILLSDLEKKKDSGYDYKLSKILKNEDKQFQLFYYLDGFGLNIKDRVNLTFDSRIELV